MALKRFKRLNTNNYEVATLQSNVSEFVGQFTGNPLLNGNIIKEVVLVSGEITAVSHGLDRKPIGYLVIAANASVDIYELVSITPNSVLNIAANATAIVNLYIF